MGLIHAESSDGVFSFEGFVESVLENATILVEESLAEVSTRVTHQFK
jgi:hypothetical protein